MVVSTHRIKIVTEYLQKGLTKTREGYRNFNQGMAVSTNRMKELQTDQGKWNKRMKESKTASGRVALGMRKATHGMRGFRMEMLGVMFFGMMLNRVFSGLIKTSLDWMGVTEIMTYALGILFLPLAEDLLTWALRFLQVVAELSPEQKKWAGTMVLTGIIIGGLLFLIGTFALGIGSLILVFKGLMGPVGLVLGLFAAFGLSKIIGEFDMFGSKADEVNGKLAAFGVTSEVFTKIFEAVKNMGRKIITYISDNYQAWIDGGLKMLTGIIDGIKDNKEKIADALESIIKQFLTWIGQNSAKLASIGIAIVSGIVKGIIDGAFMLGGEMGNLITKAMGIEHQTDVSKIASKPRELGTALTKASFMPFTGAGILIPPLQNENASQINITLNSTNNVTVSDKRELESMFAEHDIQQIEKLRRMIVV